MDKVAVKPSFYIPSLDGIRAVAFLMVFLGHAGINKMIPAGFGVTVFFFLSGYLITTLMRREYDQKNHIDLKNFYLRRTFRILPPYYLVLIGALSLAFFNLSPSQITLPPVLAQVFFYTNYWALIYGEHGQAEGTGVFWSLAIEEHFYLIFPVIYCLFRRWNLTEKQQAISLWGMCALVLSWRCFLIFFLHASSNRIYMGTDTRFDSLLFGCALAIGCNPVDNESVARNLKVWQQQLFPIGLSLLLLSFVIRDDSFRDTFRYTLQGIGLTPVFVIAIMKPKWGIIQALNWKWIKFLGTLSYSLYLVHEIIILFIRRQIPTSSSLVQGLCSFTIALGISCIVYQFIDKPGRALRKKIVM